MLNKEICKGCIEKNFPAAIWNNCYIELNDVVKTYPDFVLKVEIDRAYLNDDVLWDKYGCVSCSIDILNIEENLYVKRKNIAYGEFLRSIDALIYNHTIPNKCPYYLEHIMIESKDG